ncbi:MAG: hypothetical protein K2X64_02610, partial [Rhodocyclaceae bacterium]|nr:hypothetical protein [Rhodocyclaceae bacterium]
PSLPHAQRWNAETPNQEATMKDWLAEILVVLAHSSRTQFAIVLGMVSFVGLMVAGDYFVGRIELHGALAPLTDVVREKLFHRYDKAAWASLAACLLLAVKLYRKDRKRLLGL